MEYVQGDGPRNSGQEDKCSSGADCQDLTDVKRTRKLMSDRVRTVPYRTPTAHPWQTALIIPSQPSSHLHHSCTREPHTS